jgi:hypothetical protein
MKTLKIILPICFFILLSCEKDEIKDTPQELTNTSTQNRTGQPVPVFFDASGVFASSIATDSIQTVINLKHVDSIRYVGSWVAPFATIANTECMEYNIYFYETGNLVYERKAYAKFRGINYRQIIAPLEGWDSNILFFHSIRSSQILQSYFDHECLKSKSEHKYMIRTKYVDGTINIDNVFLKSNICNRDYIVYPRRFKI